MTVEIVPPSCCASEPFILILLLPVAIISTPPAHHGLPQRVQHTPSAAFQSIRKPSASKSRVTRRYRTRRATSRLPVHLRHTRYPRGMYAHENNSTEAGDPPLQRRGRRRGGIHPRRPLPALRARRCEFGMCISDARYSASGRGWPDGGSDSVSAME